MENIKEILAFIRKYKSNKSNNLILKDEFCLLLEKQEKCSQEEYKNIFLTYHRKFLKKNMAHFRAIRKFKAKYNFTNDWNDYFEVIDSLKSEKLKTKYINYYFWYYHNQMNEDLYKILIGKSYFQSITKLTEVSFLTHYINPYNSTDWIKKYFSPEIIKKAINNKRNYYCIEATDLVNGKKYNLENEKIIKNFYNDYEILMSKNSKLFFFDQVIKSGSLNLIDFCNEKKIIRKSKLITLWSVCSAAASNNTLDILHKLREIGVNFKPNDLINAQKHDQWNHMVHTDELIYFFETLKKEKNYYSLSKKLKLKTTKKDKKMKI